MITLKKSELETALIIISAYDKETGELKSGLLKENLTLGTKRRIQKIHKKIHESFQELVEDVKVIQKEAEKIEDLEEKGKFLQKELEDILKDEVNFEVEQFQISQIEDISTSANYNFDIIEKLAV